MKEIKAKITFTEELLGTASSDPEVHKTYIASKAPNAPKLEEEVEALGVDNIAEKSMTIFPRDKDGNPILWDYQIKGFFKDSCSALRKVTGTASSKIKAYKKEIDGLVFVFPREIKINLDGGIGICERPLRAQTAQGERVALASSETVPAGSSVEITIRCLSDAHEKAVREWLDYGQLKGLGQWRNSGKGRFTWEEIK